MFMFICIYVHIHLQTSFLALSLVCWSMIRAWASACSHLCSRVLLQLARDMLRTHACLHLWLPLTLPVTTWPLSMYFLPSFNVEAPTTMPGTKCVLSKSNFFPLNVSIVSRWVEYAGGKVGGMLRKEGPSEVRAADWPLAKSLAKNETEEEEGS